MWTKKAAAHLSAGVACLLAALITGSLGLSIVGLLFCVAVIVGYIFQRRVRANYARAASADKVRERDHVQVKGTLEAVGFGAGFVEVRDRLDKRIEVVAGSNYRILSLRRGAGQNFDYEMRTPIRGVYPIGPLQVRKTDVYELFYDVFEVPESLGGITVYPLIDDIKDANLRSLFPKIVVGISSIRNPGIGSDFYALRDYTSADPMRDVNWKASARKGELIVNQWQHETIKNVTLVFDARLVNESGTLGGNPLLFNARACATIADYFISERSSIRFVDYGEQIKMIQPDAGERQFQKIMSRLAEIDGRGNMGFIEVANYLLPVLAMRSPMVIFTSLEDDPTFFEGLSLLMARQLRLLIIVPAAPDFLRRAEGEPITMREYHVRRVKQQMEIKRLRGLGAAVAIWEPEDRLGVALLMGLAR